MRSMAVIAPRMETVKARVFVGKESGVGDRGETKSQFKTLPPEIAARVRRKRGALDTILSSLNEFNG